jgi:hypothetical protein
MMNKLVALAAGAALLALTGTAYAEQPAKKPLALSDRQMDQVTAGSLALANAGSLTFGEVLSDTISQTATNTTKIVTNGPAVAGSNGVINLTGAIVVGSAFSQGLAAGGLLFQAASVSHADTTAVW